MAKFKVGDKVRIKESAIGYVPGIFNVVGEPESHGSHFRVAITGPGVKLTYFPVDELVLANSNSALNAKFKVGDFVTDSYGMRLFEVTGIRSGGVYDVVDYENGTATYTMPEAKMRKASASLVKSYNNSTATTNPVVRNALAWRAKNAKDADGKELKVGDKIKVQVDMNGSWDGGGVITALKPYRVVEYKDVLGHINTTQENSVRKA